MNLPKFNYLLTVLTLSNLAFVTLSVWLFPKVIIFQFTTTIAWILIAIQYITAHRLKNRDS